MSTSPFRAATTYGLSRPGSSLASGWAFASEMIPTLAHRVWPSTVTSAVSALERVVEEPVVADRGAESSRVVPELPDLGGRLVDEGEQPIGRPHRAGLEERVGGPGRQAGVHAGVVEGQAVPADEEVQAGRVAAADLEAVDGRQRGLHGREAGDRRGGRAGAGEIADGPGTVEAVVSDRPERVAQRQQRRVQRLEGSAGRRGLARVEARLERVEEPGGTRRAGVEPARAGWVVEQGADPGHAPEGGVEVVEPAGRVLEHRERPVPVHDRRQRGVEGRQQRRENGRRAGGPATDHTDDSAHLGPA